MKLQLRRLQCQPWPVMRELDPRIHLLCKNVFRRWIAGS
jgi:hypothetical protein